MNRVAILLLYEVVIRGSILALDIPSAINNPTLEEHGFNKGGFPSARITEHCDVPDFTGLIYFHNKINKNFPTIS